MDPIASLKQRLNALKSNQGDFGVSDDQIQTAEDDVASFEDTFNSDAPIADKNAAYASVDNKLNDLMGTEEPEDEPVAPPKKEEPKEKKPKAKREKPKGITPKKPAAKKAEKKAEEKPAEEKAKVYSFQEMIDALREFGDGSDTTKKYIKQFDDFNKEYTDLQQQKQNLMVGELEVPEDEDGTLSQKELRDIAINNRNQQAQEITRRMTDLEQGIKKNARFKFMVQRLFNGIKDKYEAEKPKQANKEKEARIKDYTAQFKSQYSSAKAAVSALKKNAKNMDMDEEQIKAVEERLENAKKDFDELKKTKVEDYKDLEAIRRAYTIPSNAVNSVIGSARKISKYGRELSADEMTARGQEKAEKRYQKNIDKAIRDVERSKQPKKKTAMDRLAKKLGVADEPEDVEEYVPKMQTQVSAGPKLTTLVKHMQAAAEEGEIDSAAVAFAMDMVGKAERGEVDEEAAEDAVNTALESDPEEAMNESYNPVLRKILDIFEF